MIDIFTLLDWGSRALIAVGLFGIAYQQFKLAKMQKKLLENDERILGRK